MSGDERIQVVALCTVLDMIGLYGEAFRDHAPGLELLLPDEVKDPSAIRFGLAWKPADDAFDAYPNMRAVFSIGAGVDGIVACPSLPDIPVFRVEDPDQAQQMAAFAAFHVFWHHRKMGDYRDAQQRHAWEAVIHNLSPKRQRVGIMGFGHMGQAVARGLVALGYPVTTLSRRMPEAQPGMAHMTNDQMDAFLAKTDILINVLPLTPETEGLIDSAFLSRLPRGAAIIQLGRGAQLIEPDLLAALDSGQLSGASLDVFQVEPLPESSPIWDHPSVFVTPHVACIPEVSAVADSVRQGIEKFLTLA